MREIGDMNKAAIVRQIDACEAEINKSYYNLQETSMSFCNTVSNDVSNKTKVMSFWPLLISLFGIVLCTSPQSTLIGVILIVAGCVGSYYSHQYATTKESGIRNRLSEFKSVLNKNIRI